MENVVAIENITQNKKSNRIWEIDFIRGICILLMCIDHFFWDMTSKYSGLLPTFFGFDFSSSTPGWIQSWMHFSDAYYGFEPRIYLRLIVLGIFFVLSGLSCCLSRNNLKRAIVWTGVGAGITLGTTLIAFLIPSMASAFIPFGVISCYGVSILFYTLCLTIAKKIFSKETFDRFWKWTCLFLAILFIGLGIYYDYFDIYRPYDQAPNTIIGWISTIYGSIIGYIKFGADYFPLFPYLGYIFLGAFFGYTLFKDKKTLFPNGHNKVTDSISLIGRNTIWIYIFHQVLFISVLIIVFLCAGLRFNY